MEEKGTIHIHLLTELTGNLYSEESEWEEDWSESDEYGMPLDGTELADYEEVIREELKRYGEDDLMQYFDGSESIQGKIQRAVDGRYQSRIPFMGQPESKCIPS